MSYRARTILTPGASRKRKERESFYTSAAAHATATKPAARPAQALAQAHAAAKEGPAEPPAMSDNRLLAGLMAHEFLTKGTLLGTMPEAASSPRGDDPTPPKQQQPPPQQPPQTEEVGKPSGSYGEVASILKADGVHVPGILNPSQLARWIQM
ncbi:uncharacterized protein LOC104414465 [Eucalyptus grandis]|uniref:Uncharacterized protein n=2 Tax=Eucalyptus grandis TaxID=71139 RepID=A0ACC3JT54_EUCGR|nr:uncharacterized protein LOC104414465 [Eucalyptus grandis]KAK3417271.1 hypothetical protein EUGRSUZ_H03014 [Eucalyptus grandis]